MTEKLGEVGVNEKEPAFWAENNNSNNNRLHMTERTKQSNVQKTVHSGSE